MSEEREREIPDSSNAEAGRTMPYNDLDYQFLVTEPSWGREGSAELRNAVSEVVSESYVRCADCGYKYEVENDFNCKNCRSLNKERVIDKKPLWGLMSYYTRDLRLGNLTRSDMNSALYYLSLAGDLLRTNNIKSFLTSMSRVSDIIELSQSRDGFVRKRFGTITSERIDNTNAESKDKNIWTGQNRRYKNG